LYITKKQYRDFFLFGNDGLNPHFTNMILMQILTIVFAGCGLLISAYFILATFRILSGDLIGALPVCSVDGTEKRIVDTKFGRIIYIPNSIYGFLYYLGILILTVGWWSQWSEQLLFLISILSGVVVLFSIFLYYALVKKLHTICRLCVIAHLLNAGLFLIFILRTIINSV